MFKQKYIDHPVTRPGIKLPVVRAIVCHWTANENKGADAEAHYRYFNNGAPDAKGNPRAASAHIFVDDTDVLRILPESEIGYHVGDRSNGNAYTRFGMNLMQGYRTPNFVTIGYEICINSDGNFQQTEKLSQQVAAWLLIRYGLDLEHLVRHLDVTGKPCPRMYLELDKWNMYKSGVQKEMEQLQSVFVPVRVLSKGLNIRTGAGVQYSVLYEAVQGEIVLVRNGTSTGVQGWTDVYLPSMPDKSAFLNSKFIGLV